MDHLMIDLETMGIVPGCTVLSIGAVFFDVKEGLGPEFHSVIRMNSCHAAGLWNDPATEEWWSRQSAEARKVIKQAYSTKAPSLKTVLKRVDNFVRQYTNNVKVWGNGADFDNPILAVAHHRVQLRQFWKAYNGRCYRTLKNIAPGPKLERVGTHHNALDDAKSQAHHLIELFKLHPTLVLA